MSQEEFEKAMFSKEHSEIKSDHDYDKCYCCMLTERKLLAFGAAIQKNLDWLNEKINKLKEKS